MFPCSRRSIPCFLFAANSRPSPRSWSRIRAPVRSAGRDPRGFPCIFPANQGIAARDEFAPDSPHRHWAHRHTDFPIGRSKTSGKFRDSAGFWRLGSFEFEPETASFGVNQHGCSRLSLLPSRAVRFRIASSAKTSRRPASRLPKGRVAVGRVLAHYGEPYVSCGGLGG